MSKIKNKTTTVLLKFTLCRRALKPLWDRYNNSISLMLPSACRFTSTFAYNQTWHHLCVLFCVLQELTTVKQRKEKTNMRSAVIYDDELMKAYS